MPLYIVATPIGNLKDITLRALEVLGSVDLVLAEDTRVTRKLLDHYEIKTSLESFHEHTDKRKIDRILELLQTGKNIALVTDAGTPGISDPGNFLVAQVRQKLLEVSVQPIPGPSSITAAVSVAGIPMDEFVFYGFLPHKKGRQTKLKSIAVSEMPVILLESTHRIEKLLEELNEYCPDKKITLTRELTKKFEEVLTGSPKELLEFLNKNPEKTKGEFVVIISK